MKPWPPQIEPAAPEKPREPGRRDQVSTTGREAQPLSELLARSFARFFAAGRHARERGQTAEEAAVRWLGAQGFSILERNVTTRAGEIDVVALEDGVLCFVEIKARRSLRYGGAVAAVDRKKQVRLERAARLYLLTHRHPGPLRFDVLAVERVPSGNPGERWRVTLYRGAFECARP